MTGRYEIEVLRVDLTKHSADSVHVSPETVRRYIGGTGMAARILWEETKANTEPFSEENVLGFMNGPLTGTVVPSSNRCVVAAVSPLTRIWGEGYGGGTFPRALSRTPYQGIIIKGEAREPVMIWIDADGARVTDASHLWGKDCFEVDESLRKEAGQKAGIMTIGVAGEKQVKFASIVSEGRAARVVARCGLGAVMGSKKLKAIVVAEGGGRKPFVFDEEELQASVRENFPRVQFDAERWQKKIDRIWPPTRHPTCVKNVSQAELAGFVDKIRYSALESKPHYCIGCRTGCHLSMFHGNRKHPPGQHLQNLGSNCGIDDMEALVAAFELCNRLGLDSISAGKTIGFAMELFERGLLSQKDCDHIQLVWGNAHAMREMIMKISNREGIGAFLAEGVRTMAKQMGGTASEYAIHTKGLEFPRYDPRSNNAMALQYATSSRGAHHMEGFLGLVVRTLHPESPPYALPYLESKEAQDAARNLLAVQGNAELVAWSQNFSSALDSLGVCKFLAHPGVWVREPREPFAGVKPEQFLAWLNYVTGWDMDFGEFMNAGERIFNLKRTFNVRRGVTSKDDTLPARILTQPRGGKGRDSGNLPPLESMLTEYYRLRGWSGDGIPTKEKLRELDLEELTHGSMESLPL